MSLPFRGPVALVVLRCWSEDGTREGFRAHLTVVENIADEASSASYTASPAEVIDAVTAVMAEVQHPAEVTERPNAFGR